MGLEKMRKQNRMRAKGENTSHMHMRQTQSYHFNQFKQGHTIGLTIVTKELGLYYIHGGHTTTDMVVD